MQFLKTLLWVLIAVLVALLASRNWFDVTLNLWGDLQLDIKVPILLFLMFLLGFLPTFLLHRARLWGVHRRLEAQERSQLSQREPVQAEPATRAATENDPVI